MLKDSINLEGKCGSCRYGTPTKFSSKGEMSYVDCGHPEKVFRTKVAHLKQRTEKACKKYERSEVE